MQHYNLISDPGHHSYKECLVSVLWCWQAQTAMHTPFQSIVPGKILTPLDADMDADMQRYAARHKLERISAWRQIQAYSNQLRALTSKFSRPPVTIEFFKLPETFHIRAIRRNEARLTVRGVQDVSYIVDRDTGERTQVLPSGPIRAPLLNIGLDQGAIGAAGAAFMMFFLSLMVNIQFDKIHRLIRDIKKAENSCNKIWLKAKLWSAYVLSINKRPFGSGANASTKERYLDVFSVQCDISSPQFLKYLPKIAKQWRMPYGTEEEKQAIFDAVVEMRSFRAHLSHPKVANWFAWNSSVHEQWEGERGEFWGAKMVLETVLPRQTDPDSRLLNITLFQLLL